MLVTVRATLKTGAAANVRSPIRLHVGTDHVSGHLGAPTASRSGYSVSLRAPETVDVWAKYLCESVPTQLISLGEVLSALAAELAGKPPDSHRSKPFKSASSGHDSRATLRYRMSTTKSKRAASPPGASAIRGISRRAGPSSFSTISTARPRPRCAVCLIGSRGTASIFSD
jgi:hypothetical protein